MGYTKRLDVSAIETSEAGPSNSSKLQVQGVDSKRLQLSELKKNELNIIRDRHDDLVCFLAYIIFWNIG